MRHFFVFMSLLTAALVRAECLDSLQSDTPVTRFGEINDGFLVDRATGLMWSRCSWGYEWQNGECLMGSVATPAVSWQQALQTAEQAVIGGYSDWRLPNAKELDSIVERKCWAPAVALELFPNTVSGLFWTSSPNVVRPDVAMVVDFETGAHRSLDKLSAANVRLVRNVSPDR